MLIGLRLFAKSLMIDMVLLSLSLPREEEEQMATSVTLCSTCVRKYVHDNFCRNKSSKIYQKNFGGHLKFNVIYLTVIYTHTVYAKFTKFVEAAHCKN